MVRRVACFVWFHVSSARSWPYDGFLVDISHCSKCFPADWAVGGPEGRQGLKPAVAHACAGGFWPWWTRFRRQATAGLGVVVDASNPTKKPGSGVLRYG